MDNKEKINHWQIWIEMGIHNRSCMYLMFACCLCSIKHSTVENTTLVTIIEQAV